MGPCFIKHEQLKIKYILKVFDEFFYDNDDLLTKKTNALLNNTGFIGI